MTFAGAKGRAGSWRGAETAGETTVATTEVPATAKVAVDIVELQF